MKLKFKHQKFQADAAKAVCDVFAGQPRVVSTYQIDPGRDGRQGKIRNVLFTGFANNRLIPALTDAVLLKNINRIQHEQMIKPSDKIEGVGINLTVEMETGVGKTYTYIKTIYELHKLYGWSKFIIVVPSVAIREGVYKSFLVTAEHFKEEYGKQIRFFIYNSGNLQNISQFASDSSINAMIINSQAFNAKGKDARRIRMELDEFNSRRPIDVIAKTNPILIIDEPQSVEGKTTKESLKDFNPLFTLRYSATHKKDSIYNMVYRLDAIDAYNQKLVKKIAVKGISQSTTTGTSGYLYLQGIILSPSKPPRAKLEFDIKGADKIRRTTKIFDQGDDIYVSSKELDEYKDRYVIKTIDGRDNSVELLNGTKLFVGDVIGAVDEYQLRRIQIRETIISHLERERELFKKGIKVLSLFFIDQVAHYKVYNDKNEACNGEFADIFEEEYASVVQDFLDDLAVDQDYKNYLKAHTAAQIHAGYFSIDKKSKHFVDSDIKEDRKAKISNDVDAYDLIMKNKERLLDLNEPVRFIFSHSALREGWDNPNVFQICTLKQSSAEIRKRQEVGRGLRLCVNQNGERMDANAIGADVHNVNVLTVIASESYEKFASSLQTEYAEAVSDRPCKVEAKIFVGKIARLPDGTECAITEEQANAICHSLIKNDYIDDKNTLTAKYYDDKSAQRFTLPEQLKPLAETIVKVLDNIYDPSKIKAENAAANNVVARINENKIASKEFKALWAKISAKSAYCVDFDTSELVAKSIEHLNKELFVGQRYFTITEGSMAKIDSREALENNEAFTATKSETKFASSANEFANVRYDLIGRIVAETGLTRKTIVEILRGILPEKFDMFKINPEDFIIRASRIINEQKATVIVQHIVYNKIDAKYDTSIFTEPTLKGRLNVNAMETPHHLYDYLIYDSSIEKNFAQEFEIKGDVVLYAKLPKSFYINTPVGNYSPDWAIVFKEDKAKHIYFVAETKGDMSSLNLRGVENAKIDCAKKHFAAICQSNITCEVVRDYKDLMEKAMK